MNCFLLLSNELSLLFVLFVLTWSSFAFNSMHKISVRTRSSYFDDSQLFKMKNLEDENKYQQDDIGSLHRRGFIQTIAKTATLLSIVPLPAVAGEVGAKITRAVTTSDLGISVRTSVVKGAQIMDRLDGQWENFSDRYSLGAERSKAGKRPLPKEIPDLLDLNIPTAKRLLAICDTIFLSQISTLPTKSLEERIEKVANLAQASFDRSGVKLNVNNNLEFQNASQFNFAVYAHFKAYSDILVEQQIAFAPFKRNFEMLVGEKVMTEFLPTFSILKQQEATSRNAFEMALTAVDSLCQLFREQGLVAAYEVDKVDEEKISDWLEDDLSDLTFNVALDGDATLNAQILLQEQGFRLYPNLARYAINSIMSSAVKKKDQQKVSTMDYYFDTDYSSNPDKFEVKQVLVTVSLENP